MTEADHDILITLVANTAELRTKQTEMATLAALNHKEIKEQISKLENGFAHRLNEVESKKFPSVDFIQFRNYEFIPLIAEVKDLKTWKNKVIGALIVLNILLGVAMFLINKFT